MKIKKFRLAIMMLIALSLTITVKSSYAFYGENSNTASSSKVTGVILTAVGITAVAGLAVALFGTKGGSDSIKNDGDLKEIAITPASPVIASGLKLQLTAIGIFVDNTEPQREEDLTKKVTWKSSDSSIATINEQGLVKALKPGSVSISAAYAGIQVTQSLTVSTAALVSLKVKPVNPSIAGGVQQQFTAIGKFSDQSEQDITEQVKWTSSDHKVATISNVATMRGLATAKSVTTAEATIITATWGKQLHQISAAQTLTVSPATIVELQITPDISSIASNTQLQLTAIGVFSDKSRRDITAQINWTSSDSTVAGIGNTKGIKGLVIASTRTTPGTTTITATFGAVSKTLNLSVTAASVVSIQMTPSIAIMAQNAEQQFTVMGAVNDGSTQDLTGQATWTSSNEAVATVSKGKVQTKSVAVDTAVTITATVGANSCAKTFLVSAKSPNTVGIATATNPSTNITALTIANGTTQQLIATLYYDGFTQNATNQVAWQSSNDAIIQVNQGLLTAQGSGLVTITANYLDLEPATVTVNAVNANLNGISINPKITNIAFGTQQQFTATGIFSGGLSQDLTNQATWISGSETVAVIDSKPATTCGLMTAIQPGTTNITATFGGASSIPQVVTVSNATLVSLAVAPNNATQGFNKSFSYLATGTFSDGSTQDLTSNNNLTWASSNNNIVVISNAPSSKGLATTQALGGVATITANWRGIIGSTSLTVQ